jgi:hypothetical protein
MRKNTIVTGRTKDSIFAEARPSLEQRATTPDGVHHSGSLATDRFGPAAVAVDSEERNATEDAGTLDRESYAATAVSIRDRERMPGRTDDGSKGKGLLPRLGGEDTECVLPCPRRRRGGAVRRSGRGQADALRFPGLTPGLDEFFQGVAAEQFVANTARPQPKHRVTDADDLHRLYGTVSVTGYSCCQW